jgi:hypothetical protein
MDRFVAVSCEDFYLRYGFNIVHVWSVLFWKLSYQPLCIDHTEL